MFEDKLKITLQLIKIYEEASEEEDEELNDSILSKNIEELDRKYQTELVDYLLRENDLDLAATFLVFLPNKQTAYLEVNKKLFDRAIQNIKQNKNIDSSLELLECIDYELLEESNEHDEKYSKLLELTHHADPKIVCGILDLLPFAEKGDWGIQFNERFIILSLSENTEIRQTATDLIGTQYSQKNTETEYDEEKKDLRNPKVKFSKSLEWISVFSLIALAFLSYYCFHLMEQILNEYKWAVVITLLVCFSLFNYKMLRKHTILNQKTIIPYALQAGGLSTCILLIIGSIVNESETLQTEKLKVLNYKVTYQENTKSEIAYTVLYKSKKLNLSHSLKIPRDQNIWNFSVDATTGYLGITILSIKVDLLSTKDLEKISNEEKRLEREIIDSITNGKH